MEDLDQEDGTMDKVVDKAADKVVDKEVVKEVVKEVDTSLVQQQHLIHSPTLCLLLASTW